METIQLHGLSLFVFSSNMYINKGIFTCVLRTWEISEFEALFKKFDEKQIPYYHHRKLPRAADLFRLGPQHLINTWHNVYVPNQNVNEAMALIKEYVTENGAPPDVFVAGTKTSITEYIETALFYLFIVIVLYIVEPISK